MRIRKSVYSGRLKLNGEESRDTIREAGNYASTLHCAERYAEAKSLLRRILPVARRVFGECHDITIKIRWVYAQALYADPASTLDDLREAVTTLEELERITRRVLGGSHPLKVDIEDELRDARAALRARETPSPPG